MKLPKRRKKKTTKKMKKPEHWKMQKNFGGKKYYYLSNMKTKTDAKRTVKIHRGKTFKNMRFTSSKNAKLSPKSIKHSGKFPTKKGKYAVYFSGNVK
jgi:hypothetical protein